MLREMSIDLLAFGERLLESKFPSTIYLLDYLCPHHFGELQRRARHRPDLWFTLRFEYAELGIDNAVYIYVPFCQESAKTQSADI